MPKGRPWEGVWQPPPPDSRGDILAEERARPRRMWWPGNWLRGRAGVVAVVLFLAGSTAYLAWGWVDLPGGGVSAPAPGAADHPEAGRSLTPVEYAAGRRYGRPLFLGDGGLPMVRLDSTDEVRELTPVEMEHTSSAPHVSAGRQDVVWTTGPRGWGLWWEEDPEGDVMNAFVEFPRMAWHERQDGELARAVDRVSLAMRFLGAMEFRPWLKGLGEPVYLISDGLRARYPVTAYGLWSEVPERWACSDTLEADLNQGVTQGCPGDEYMTALRGAWFELGHVVYIMHGMGALGVRMDRMDAESLYQSELIGAQAYHMIDLLEEVAELDAALRLLRDISRREGLPITAILVFG